MSALLKTKIALLAFCLAAVAASSLYLKGVDDGIAAVDQEAFDSYVHFAKQMHVEIHRPTRHRDDTVWAAIDGKGR